MQYTRSTYGDPTGGGDDITLTAPMWVDPPKSLHVYDSNNNLLEFELEETVDDD
jgi:hypothetical protein